jgi:copper transport protein
MGMRRFPVRALRDLLQAVALTLVLVLALVLQSGTASAHAVLVSSTPEAGQRLDAPPTRLVLKFSEPVSEVVTTLVSRKGEPVRLPSTVAGDEVTIDLAKPLSPGAYALSWRVVSEDGHPVAASIVFAVGRDAILAGLAGATAAPAWLQALTWATKFLFYASCLFGVGGAFFAVWIVRRAPTRRVAIPLVSAAICALLLVGFLGLEENGASIAALGQMQTWAEAVKSSLARSMALVALALLSAAIARPGMPGGKALSAASLLALGTGFALTGHASGAGIAWLSFAAVSAHVAAVCFWSGSLPGLWRLLAQEDGGQGQALSRFSAAILVSVTVMIATGSYLAYIQVGTIAGLFYTDYGKVLATKLALVATALALGAYNRFRLTPRVQQGDAPAMRAMRAVVSIEILLIVLVLGVTALWRFTPPPRALALRHTVVSLHLHDPVAMAMVTFKTGPDLAFDVDLAIETGTFKPLDPQEVTLRMSTADGTVAPFKVPLRHVAPGLWRAGHFQAPCDCHWTLRVDIFVTDFDLVTLNGTVRLLPDH